MAKVADVQKAVAELSPKDLAKFRAWFATFAAKPAAAEAAGEPKGPEPETLAQLAFKTFKSGRTRNL